MSPSLLLILVLTFSVVSANHSGIINCFKSYNISLDDLANFIDDPASASDNLKCSLKCIAEHYDVMSETGILDLEKTVDAEHADLENASRKCVAILQPSADPCEMVYVYQKCMIEEEREWFRAFITTLKME